ncbi:tRNA 2-thiocytidine(32) synthetase TtcA [Flammeovirga pacifica]|uniref:tRNA-cytidine(32) 2-sulfurtransferase n=1 Tax=Flammeovirga pacifica TaxID=915059 RepID=A0A1S1YYD9_FLAPC|nr:tRNA 2-thiocytidine(32) synthetase TtcA [Flammeovirga pacifica]OHX65943.1 tRNA 2-thiocytidine(32) synthetase TtcA [Flammeovirga pacifica]
MTAILTAEQIKLQKRLHKNVWKAIDDYHLIENGDKVMVCLSGGKDSYAMLEILLHIQSTKKYDFEIIAVNLDQKQPGFPEHILPEYLENKGVNYKILNKDTYSIVTEKLEEGKTMCSLCSRLRRGTLYTAAEELGVTKIALGHHRDDIIETFLLNMFFSGKLEAMPPIYKTDDQKHIVIRPLAYCKEKDIEEYAQLKEFPIIPCNLCGSQPKLQRQMIKQMLKDWEKDYPDRSEVIFNSIKNVSPSHLMDKELYDYQLFKMIEPAIKN